MQRFLAYAAASAAFCLGVSAPLLAQAAVDWQRVHADEEGEYFVDPASLRRSGDKVRATMRLVPPPADAGRAVTYIVDYDFDCAGHTMAILAGRELGPHGEELRAFTMPAERVRPEPVFAGTGAAPIYLAHCPAAALPEPPPMPMIIATSPGSPGRGCRETEQAGSCGAESSNPNP